MQSSPLGVAGLLLMPWHGLTEEPPSHITIMISAVAKRGGGGDSRATAPGDEAKGCQQVLPSRGGAWDGVTSDSFGLWTGITHKPV